MLRAAVGSTGDRLAVPGIGKGQGVLAVLCFYSQSIGVLSLGVSHPACPAAPWTGTPVESVGEGSGSMNRGKRLAERCVGAGEGKEHTLMSPVNSHGKP